MLVHQMTEKQFAAYCKREAGNTAHLEWVKSERVRRLRQQGGFPPVYLSSVRTETLKRKMYKANDELKAVKKALAAAEKKFDKAFQKAVDSAWEDYDDANGGY